MRRALRLSCAVLAGAAAAPSSASAARVEVIGGALYVAAPRAEHNVLDISAVGLEWEVEESRAGLIAGPGCQIVEERLARCRGTVLRVSVAAGPRQDLVTVWNATVPVRLEGGSGRDLLEGGPGADEIDGGPGPDSLWGGAGDDVIEGAGGGDLLHGMDGDDTLSSGDGHDILNGEGGRDKLLGGNQRDLLEGGPGDDRVDGQDGADAIVDGPGEDEVEKSEEDDRYGLPPKKRACTEGEPCPSPSARPSRPPRWPPDEQEGATASRAFARTKTTLRTRRRPRGVTVFVDTVGSFLSTVTLTWRNDANHRLGRRATVVVETDHLRTIRTPRPPRGTAKVSGRCRCEG